MESPSPTRTPPAPDAPADAHPTLRLRRLSDRATLPKYHSELAAGLDLAACLPAGETVVIAPGEVALQPAPEVRLVAALERQLRAVQDEPVPARPIAAAPALAVAFGSLAHRP